MSEITLEAIEAKQTELATMIAKFKAATAQPRVVAIGAITIELQPGEHYAGTVLNDDGSVRHHLVLMAARPDDELDFDDVNLWASESGGSLPTRQEAALIYANCKSHVDPVWHWTSERHENDASYAWMCNFNDGSQGYDDTSVERAARAVRYVEIFQ